MCHPISPSQREWLWWWFQAGGVPGRRAHCLLDGEDEGDNQAVQSQHLGEDEDEDHAHK